ncbi:hypothetical protein GCM10011384_18170 [Psychrobacillus lasiicapitis]|nr:hypothetical protein GCM10011384_18170 [Psychrobacillus lasiicapitis]
MTRTSCEVNVIRIKKIFWIFLVIILLGIIIIPIVTIQANKHTYKKRVANYLIEEKVYEKRESNR